jgi:hypothetical protein
VSFGVPCGSEIHKSLTPDDASIVIYQNSNKLPKYLRFLGLHAFIGYKQPHHGCSKKIPSVRPCFTKSLKMGEKGQDLEI